MTERKAGAGHTGAFGEPGEPGAFLEPHGRRTMPAGRVLIVMLVALLVWALLYAPSLKRASEAQPLGTRRTVSLWVLGPLAAFSDAVRLSTATDGASQALGRDPDAAPGGTIDVEEPEDIPTIGPSASVSPTPDEPVDEDTKIRRPTTQDELRVVVVGDSLAAGLGVYLEREFDPDLVRVSRQGRISTGLSRLDYFDWMSEMREDRGELSPRPRGRDDRRQRQPEPAHALGTDRRGDRDLPSGRRGTRNASRSSRASRSTAAPTSPGWGCRSWRRKERWPVMQRQNDIFERVVDETPNAVYVDTWDRFATRDGAYTPFYWTDGNVELIRASDGLHFNPRGYELVAEAVGEAAVEHFRLPRRAIGS